MLDIAEPTDFERWLHSVDKAMQMMAYNLSIHDCEHVSEQDLHDAFEHGHSPFLAARLFLDQQLCCMDIPEPPDVPEVTDY